ncbi:hypothetical protein [Paenibacillus sp. V4I7]|uniref:hypothetical protein n=1 Tax=Paenibacillus sp. V4I7 TaxID=3042307 RepID=UPI00278651B7|nr:hypothetical protein [Paenibacillus sp. V4I7]MDQ0901239.1 hypothetical protein [Paenibacillus sp. V4I7]
MCVGYPDQHPTQRPRLPVETIVHHERYSTESYAAGIESYNQAIREFLLTRTGENRDSDWSMEMAARLRSRKRDHLRSFLHDQGFDLK